MAIRSEREIYQLLEKHLREQTEPVTVTHLMDIQEIRDEAVAEFGGSARDLRMATNKLSDTLGFMWRRGLLTRFPAPKTELSFARYAYQWAKGKEFAMKALPPPIRSSGEKSFNVIRHEDGVEIQFDKFSVFVKPN